MSQPDQRTPGPDRDEEVPRGEDLARPGMPDDLTEPADRMPGEPDAAPEAAPGPRRATPEPPD